MRGRVVILLCLAGALAFASGCDETDFLFVDNAMLASPADDGANQLVASLFVVPGHQRVLIFRWWDSGMLFTADDQVYRKLSIQIPSVKSGSWSLDDREVVVRYASGGSAWIRKGSGEVGSEATGRLKVTPAGPRALRVELDIRLAAFMAQNSQLPVEPIRLSSVFRMHEVSLEALTPWEGQPTTDAAASAWP